MKYFTNFPIIEYPFKDKTLKMMDVFIRPDITVTFSSKTNENFTTLVQDGWSPDKASREIYNNDDYFWFLLQHNDIIDFYSDWPTSYEYWIAELSRIYTGETYYIPEQKNFQAGDIVTLKSNNSSLFDTNNCGVITEANTFFRSFDVTPLKGKITEGSSFYVIRKMATPPYYTIIYDGSLMRKESKLNSVAQFYTRTQSNKKVNISPYFNIRNSSSVSSGVSNILNEPDTILSQYITKQESNFLYDSFLTLKQKEWLFKRNIKTIPIADLNILDNAYAEFFIPNEE